MNIDIEKQKIKIITRHEWIVQGNNVKIFSPKVKVENIFYKFAICTHLFQSRCNIEIVVIWSHWFRTWVFRNIWLERQVFRPTVNAYNRHNGYLHKTTGWNGHTKGSFNQHSKNKEKFILTNLSWKLVLVSWAKNLSTGQNPNGIQFVWLLFFKCIKIDANIFHV